MPRTARTSSTWSPCPCSSSKRWFGLSPCWVFRLCSLGAVHGFGTWKCLGPLFAVPWPGLRDRSVPGSPGVCLGAEGVFCPKRAFGGAPEGSFCFPGAVLGGSRGCCSRAFVRDVLPGLAAHRAPPEIGRGKAHHPAQTLDYPEEQYHRYYYKLKVTALGEAGELTPVEPFTLRLPPPCPWLPSPTTGWSAM